MSIKGICGVILTTDNMEGMVNFYINILGLPLEKEEHGDLELHYGLDLGTLHFAIHPLADFGETESGNAATKIAFQVESLEKHVMKLENHGHHPVHEPHDEGFGPVASFKDPDGNLIELVELSYEFKGGN